MSGGPDPASPPITLSPQGFQPRWTSCVSLMLTLDPSGPLDVKGQSLRRACPYPSVLERSSSARRPLTVTLTMHPVFSTAIPAISVSKNAAVPVLKGVSPAGPSPAYPVHGCPGGAQDVPVMCRGSVRVCSVNERRGTTRCAPGNSTVS